MQFAALKFVKKANIHKSEKEGLFPQFLAVSLVSALFI